MEGFPVWCPLCGAYTEYVASQLAASHAGGALDKAKRSMRAAARILPCIDHHGDAIQGFDADGRLIAIDARTGDRIPVLGFVFGFASGGVSDTTLRTFEECSAERSRRYAALQSAMSDDQCALHRLTVARSGREQRAAKRRRYKELRSSMSEGEFRATMARQNQRRRCAAATDGYVNQLLGVKAAPADLVEAKRIQLKLKRLLKEKA